MKHLGSFIPPILTTTERDAITSPKQWEVILNSTTSAYEYWDGATWQQLSGGGGANELNDLTDVTTGLPGSPTNADDGRLLYFDVATGDFVTDDFANISNVVKDCKTSIATGTIAKGTPVYLDGYDNDLLVVEAADAASAGTMACIGIAAETITSTGPNKVISFGKIQNIDTTGLSTGQILWVASGGGLTTTRPTGSTNIVQQVAVVLKQNETAGSIKVFNTSRAAGLPNLTTDYIWQGDNNSHPQEVYPWIPPMVDVSSGTAGQSAALVATPIGTGAGHYRNFDGGANDTWATIVPLYNNGLAYDGRNISIDLHWMPFGAPGAGDNVEWTVEYYFGRDGIDVYTQATTSVATLVDVSARTSQLQYTDNLGTISGTAGDTQLHIIIRRNSQGGAVPDNYAGDCELYSITFR
jgi:hypothetical protein